MSQASCMHKLVFRYTKSSHKRQHILAWEKPSLFIFLHMIDRKKLMIVCKCSNVIQIDKVSTNMSERVKSTLHDTMPIETGVLCIGGKV